METSAWQDSPSRVRIEELNANLVDRMQIGLLPLNAASYVIPSVFSDLTAIVEINSWTNWTFVLFSPFPSYNVALCHLQTNCILINIVLGEGGKGGSNLKIEGN